MNTLRSMRPAVAPMLSTKWMARRELPAVLCAGLPAVMMGPEDDDQQSDNEDEVDDTDPDYVPGACLTPLVVVVVVCCSYLPVCMYAVCVDVRFCLCRALCLVSLTVSVSVCELARDKRTGQHAGSS
jgi:hypothetical protein